MKLVPRSLRWRIQLWHGLVLLAVLAGFGGMAWQLNASNEDRRRDAELRLRVGALSNALVLNAPPANEQNRGDRPPPPRADGPPPRGSFRLRPETAALFSEQEREGFYFVMWTRHGDVMARSPNAPEDVPQPSRLPDFTRSRDGFREASHTTPPGECLLAGISEAPLRDDLRRFALKLATLGSVILVLGWAGGGWVTARAIAPLQEISGTARRIAQGAMRERIPVPENTRELAEVAEVLNATFARLEAAFLEQARFTSDAAHELRTPVSIILAQAQLALARPRTAEELGETIATIRRSADRMKSLIESLLELSVLDAQSEAVPFVWCDLAELAREQLDAMQPMAAERQIVLEGDCAPAPCGGDPDRLIQVFSNLIGNALKYCRPGDRVQVTTGRQNGYATASVADTGPGIAAEHHAHLFERFYRADLSRSRATGGAGLGLAICQTIIGAHGGSISIEPSAGPGMTFTVRLPGAKFAS